MHLSNSDLTRELPVFIAQWTSLCENSNSLFTQLNEFIADWQLVLGSISADKPLPSTELDTSALSQFRTEMAPLMDVIRKERQKGESANVWEVSGLKRDEVRISSALAWFLDYYGEHGQEGALLASLVESIKPIPEGFPHRVHVLSSPYWINIESCPSGDKCSRVDIEIEGECFLLFIEVKIDAPETNTQLDRYLEIGEKKAGGRPWGVIFLTPTGCKPLISIVAKESNRLVCMSWNNVARTFDAYAQSLPKCFSQSVLRQFKHFISSF